MTSNPPLPLTPPHVERELGVAAADERLAAARETVERGPSSRHRVLSHALLSLGSATARVQGGGTTA